ncbi:MAG: hypothetical protein J5I98_22975, partial [Phaeodactylibacter sp.]|nr:hypothetical protein [Phaeodactylibacter sp.]
MRKNLCYFFFIIFKGAHSGFPARRIGPPPLPPGYFSGGEKICRKFETQSPKGQYKHDIVAFITADKHRRLLS